MFKLIFGSRSADAGPEAKAETSENQWVLPRAINIYGQHPTVQQGPYHGKRLVDFHFNDYQNNSTFHKMEQKFYYNEMFLIKTFVRPRSADAKPESEAEAEAYYSYYGYGARPYSGYRGYFGRGFFWG